MSDKLEFLFLDPSDERWMQFISSQQQATLLHHPAWINLIAESYVYTAFILAVVNKKGGIEAGVPFIKMEGALNKKRWISLPFTDHCAPLYKSIEALEFLTASLIDLSRDRKIRKIELRWAYPTHSEIQPYSNFVLTRLWLASDEEQMAKRVKPKQYRNIKAAYKRGVHIEWGTDLKHLRAFYDLHLRTRRRLGVPVQPWNFFEKLGELIIKKGYGFILLAYKEQVCVAGAIFLHWNKILIYKYSAWIEEARYLKAMYPILWTAICWGGNRDFYRMDMGRSDLADHGLRTFKQCWGAEEFPLIYSFLPHQSSGFIQEKLKPMMQLVIQKSPIWVCRLTGELFYRYFG